MGNPCSGGGEDVMVDVYSSDGRTVPAEVRMQQQQQQLGSESTYAKRLNRQTSQNVSILCADRLFVSGYLYCLACLLALSQLIFD